MNNERMDRLEINGIAVMRDIFSSRCDHLESVMDDSGRVYDRCSLGLNRECNESCPCYSEKRHMRAIEILMKEAMRRIKK